MKKTLCCFQKNIDSFGYKNVTIRKEAVWTKNTLLQFSSEGSMSSKIETGQAANAKQVTAIRLKDLLDKPVDFLKIDIEGAEFEVMCDLDEKLSFVKNLFLEYHGSFEQTSQLTKLFTILSKNGFSYYIKEATSIYKNPFTKKKDYLIPYDIQLNIFCFRNSTT